MKLALRAALLSAKSLAPLAVIILLMALFGGTRAQAMDWGSAADVSGDFIQLTSYSVVNYADCEWSYMCGAYVQGQEYVDGRFTGWSQDGDWDVMDAQVAIWDYGSSGSTYTIAGFHYFYNDYLATWENYGYDSDAVTYVVQQATPEQPIIGGIYPSSGPAGHDGWIGIYGWYLSGDGSCNVSVTLDGSPVTVTYVSDYQVNVAYSGNSSPLLSLGIKTVQLTTCWGSSAIINDSSDQFTVNGGDPTPSISSVSPANWTYGQANTITVQGSGFGSSPDLGFVTPEGIAAFASITNSTDTVINATVPAYHGLVSGSVGVQVFSHGYNGTFIPQHTGQPGYSAMNTSAKVVVPDPTPVVSSVGLTINSVNQTSLVAGNVYNVTVYGTGFGTAPSVTVWLPGGGQMTFSGGNVSAFDNYVTASASFTLAVPGTTPGGYAGISVTSSGYNSGLGFQGGGTNGGGSSSGYFTIPVFGIAHISSLAPNTFVVGPANLGVTINGSGFGSAQGSVSVVGNAGGYSSFGVTGWTDSTIGGSLTLAQGTSSAQVQVFPTGNMYSQPMTVETVEIQMQLSQVGVTVINSSNNYSEDTTIKVQAVRADNGVPVTTFGGTVFIAEDTSLLRYHEVYTDNTERGASLPESVFVSANGGGSTTFVARSLATSWTGIDPPNPAKIMSTNYSVYGGDLTVPQWITPAATAPIDPRASGPVPAWFQTQTNDVFAHAGGDTRTVLNSIFSYTVGYINGGAGGKTDIRHDATSPVTLNPYLPEMRANKDGLAVCGHQRAGYLQNSLIHEARHVYQGIQTTQAADADQDFLVNAQHLYSVAPNNVVTDSTAQRTTCTAQPNGASAISQTAYLGDAAFDSLANVQLALEEDAYSFADGR